MLNHSADRPKAPESKPARDEVNKQADANDQNQDHP